MLTLPHDLVTADVVDEAKTHARAAVIQHIEAAAVQVRPIVGSPRPVSFADFPGEPLDLIVIGPVD